MSYIAVDNLKQGMVVDQDVRDINDRLLLSKGQEINDKHLRILKIWGVAEVSVVAATEPPVAEEAPTDVEKATRVKDSLDFIFQHLDISRSTINDVYRLSFLHRYRSPADTRTIDRGRWSEMALPQMKEISISMKEFSASRSNCLRRLKLFRN